ncbi:PspC domain-containing protein [Nicoliella spurrieriana]|uniref:PspC domain-containing protein n=1 Tax=Nicoliella spurrieriana TaxID=2925830 RepID=A0A976X5V6_9LACO|nr:PspC domain-containing protein [Nicoliella spurrieriana]UQS87358.1 PspC domain-containing protein [Nicoliella spurrieriana]
MNKKLYRSNDRIICGVLGGIAEYFGWDKTWTRLIYAALTILSFAFAGLILYIVAAIIIPNQPKRREVDAQEFDQK